mmetsp:Transcript_35685/g.77890  ORF Transcript_35685/g.77890 Transcript_35685/m.77890 type:complete len:298 (-) Transcript_35685:640-1533(-)|eukprot:CAMPEP_0118921604 /NCGR_PEP_ID=MMETSP1169-20130426/820_1 /TAXON_ID=36882 /ORGANISM="Pyramimonas obovata, Strain CCMP722" /LENGTH=297 /DNA_ID=CAMNT_0006862355 /DNA_START=437 /DNA_END=1333 /DNA_ORIENTATION=+
MVGGASLDGKVQHCGEHEDYKHATAGPYDVCQRSERLRKGRHPKDERVHATHHREVAFPRHPPDVVLVLALLGPDEVREEVPQRQRDERKLGQVHQRQQHARPQHDLARWPRVVEEVGAHPRPEGEIWEQPEPHINGQRHGVVSHAADGADVAARVSREALVQRQHLKLRAVDDGEDGEGEHAAHAEGGGLRLPHVGLQAGVGEAHPHDRREDVHEAQEAHHGHPPELAQVAHGGQGPHQEDVRQRQRLPRGEPEMCHSELGQQIGDHVYSDEVDSRCGAKEQKDQGDADGHGPTWP